MAPVLVDAAHSIDRDFLDQQFLSDPRVIAGAALVSRVGAARCRVGRGPVGSGVLLHENPPAVGCDDTGPRLDRWRPMLVTVWGGAAPVTMLPAGIAPSGWAVAAGRG